MKIGFDDFLVRNGAEKFKELMKAARLTLDAHLEEGTSTDLILGELTQLKDEILKEQTFKAIANRAGVSIGTVRAEYQKRVLKKEATEEEKEETFTPEEMEKAKELLKSPDILEKMLDLTSRRGYVGEEINKKMLFLSFTSRHLIQSISTIVKGASASGKSALVNSILSLIPKKDFLSFSFITPKALPPFARDISHKILFIQEQPGSQGADYSIRTTLSEGEISIAIPIKDEVTGNFTTVEKRIPAVGMVFVETTTKEQVHAENQTRIFDLYIDESQEQTEKVLNAEAEWEDKLAPELQKEMKIWRAAQTLIESHEVYIPYSKKLVQAFPKDKVRVRRDFPRFLSLIKVHVLLHQFQREKDAKGRLIATKEDLEAVLPLAEVVLVQSHKEVSPKLEHVLETVEKEFGVNQELSFGELEPKIKYKGRTLRDYLKKLKDLDLLSHNGKTGKESRYVLLFPIASIASMSNFGARCLKLLENSEANSDSPQSASSPQSDAEGTDKVNEAKSDENGFTSKDDKENSESHLKTSVDANSDSPQQPPSSPQSDVDEMDGGNRANRGENDFALKNTKDDRKLHLKTPFRAKRQKEPNEDAHSEICDCDSCVKTFRLNQAKNPVSSINPSTSLDDLLSSYLAKGGTNGEEAGGQSECFCNCEELTPGVTRFSRTLVIEGKPVEINYYEPFDTIEIKSKDCRKVIYRDKNRQEFDDYLNLVKPEKRKGNQG